jgi:hypothetical protein
MWDGVTGQYAARQLRLLLIICPIWARATTLILLHATGTLRASASTLVATLHHASGNLRPLLRDVHGSAAIGAPIPPLPRVARHMQASTLLWWLLLPALN